MRILGIDPGPVQSAWVSYDTRCRVIINFGQERNEAILTEWTEWGQLDGPAVIEQMAPYGKPLTAPLRETIRWSGRIEQELLRKSFFDPVVYVDRPTVLTWLCGRRNKASKAQAKAALCGRLWNTDLRGAKTIGGPGHGMHGDHLWDALACAVWYAETQGDEVVS